jgi:hypothetical protein
VNINWESIAANLAFALKRLEEEPMRIKNWNRAYDAVKAYDHAAGLAARARKLEDIDTEGA